MKRKIILTIVTLVFIVTGAGTVQASPNHGQITGVVHTADGEPLSNVTVTVTSPNLMGERDAITNHRGSFRFPALPIGDYILRFEHDTMKTLVRSEVTVKSYGTVTVSLKMVEGSPDEIMEVSGPSDMIDITSSSERKSMDGDFIQRLPGAGE